MFGKNPIRKQDLTSPERLRVQEIFYTIQGEGPFQGEPCVFIRLWGCNLKCYWCDTDFESNDWNPSVTEIVSEVLTKFKEMGTSKGYKPPLVVITGGEPLRQNLLDLLGELSDRSIHTQIETNGTLWVDGLQYFIARGELTLVCSPKTGKVHDSIREWCEHWKYIIDELSSSPEDGLPMASTQVEGKSMEIARPDFSMWPEVWVQPLDESHHAINKTARNTQHAVKVAMKYGYRLCLQQHKMVGLP